MRYSFDCVRRMTLPRTMAGVASDISLSVFLPSSLNSGPAWTTKVSPSSLNRKILPLYAQGEAREPARLRRDPLAAVNLLAGPRVVAQQETAVEQRVVVVAVHERRGLVGAEQRLVPDDVLVAGFVGLERDVAGRAGTDGVHGPRRRARVARVDVEQPVLGERRRRDVHRHPAQLPEQLAVQIVRTDLVHARGDDLGAQLVLPDERRRPVLDLFALDAPELLAGLLVERDDERLGGVVVDDDEAILVERGRRRRAEGLPAVERRQLLGPDRLAVEIERGHDAGAAEVHVDAFAVGDRRFRREAVLEVPLNPRHAAHAARAPSESCRS